MMVEIGRQSIACHIKSNLMGSRRKPSACALGMECMPNRYWTRAVAYPTFRWRSGIADRKHQH